MKDANVKTIRFPITADQKLQKLAEKTGLTKIEFFIYMVEYFYKSKKYPRDLNDELLKKEINKKTDNIVAFIKTQEQELLRPLNKDGERAIAIQGKIVDFFNQHIIAHNKDQTKAYNSQQVKLEDVHQIIKRMELVQKQALSIKNRSIAIFESFVKTREQMGVMTKQVDKDGLVQNYREQFKNL